MHLQQRRREGTLLNMQNMNRAGEQATDVNNFFGKFPTVQFWNETQRECLAGIFLDGEFREVCLATKVASALTKNGTTKRKYTSYATFQISNLHFRKKVGLRSSAGDVPERGKLPCVDFEQITRSGTDLQSIFAPAFHHRCFGRRVSIACVKHTWVPRPSLEECGHRSVKFSLAWLMISDGEQVGE